MIIYTIALLIFCFAWLNFVSSCMSHERISIILFNLSSVLSVSFFYYFILKEHVQTKRILVRFNKVKIDGKFSTMGEEYVMGIDLEKTINRDVSGVIETMRKMRKEIIEKSGKIEIVNKFGEIEIRTIKKSI